MFIPCKGKLDERLPLLSIMVPRRLRLSWPDAVKHLNANQDRLVTLFDVHSTLQHVLTQQYGPRYTGKVARSTRGYSLFSKINSDRTCAQASIAAHWCSCLEWRPLLHREENMLYLKRRNGHPLSTAAINMTVTQYLNERIRILRSHIQEGWPTCSDIQVTKILSAEEAFLADDLVRFNRSKDEDGRIPEFLPHDTGIAEMDPHPIRIELEIEPGEAHLEAVISSNKVGIHILQLRRLDVYEHFAWCAPVNHWPELRQFCICGT